MTTKFRTSNGERVRNQQTFDRENIFIVKAGNKYNVYDMIQEANQDTDIYKTLEKYGSIEPMMRYDLKEIQEDFDDFETMITLHDKQQAAQKMWENLSPGIREKFNNDRQKFLDEGPDWLKKLQTEAAAEAEKNKTPENTTQPVIKPVTKEEVK